MHYEYCFLDIAFIAGLGMGAEGAGYANCCVSNLLSFCLRRVYIWKKIPVLRLTKEDLVATQKDIREHCRISFQWLFASIIAIGTIMVPNRKSIRPTSVAAHTAAQRLISWRFFQWCHLELPWLLCPNYGARKYDRIWLGVVSYQVMPTFAIELGFILNLFSPLSYSRIRWRRAHMPLN